MPAPTRLRLFAADLHYPPELAVHTALSGAIGHLAARYLVIEGAGGFLGVGEVRANIAYLTTLPEEGVAPAIVALSRALPWSMPPAELLAALPSLAGDAPAIARAAVENALVEGLARADGQPVATYLGGTFRPAMPTNQCLFWGPDQRFDQLAARYVAEGFRDLKVRIAVGDLDHDLARLRRLRERYGDTIRIAVDANGAWDGQQAARALALLAPLDLAYVEQPTRPHDWDGFRTLLRGSPMKLMADESLATSDDIERLADCGPNALAHLKIAKSGGPLALLRAARRLERAGIGLMVGQMNEGGLATAMTAHCAMALLPEHAELYGCYGLLDDRAPGVRYAGGAVVLPDAPGLGLQPELAGCSLLWDERLG
ncbi:MAG: mandelate racemase/muconate lactonizing enzyme family protein [Acetobacteraceae bacterium]|nr:mandelate racemase/muconate lactonizing enzyme family protein [Acetobacteraceae bacterium]